MIVTEFILKGSAKGQFIKRNQGKPISKNPHKTSTNTNKGVSDLEFVVW